MQCPQLQAAQLLEELLINILNNNKCERGPRKYPSFQCWYECYLHINLFIYLCIYVIYDTLATYLQYNANKSSTRTFTTTTSAAKQLYVVISYN